MARKVTRSRAIVVLPDRIVSDWWRREGHSLAMEDLDEVLVELPERLVPGGGAQGGLHPDPAMIAQLERRAVQAYVLVTRR